MKLSKITLLPLAVGALAFTNVSCEKKTPTDEAVDNMEEAAENVGDAAEDLGDSVEDAVDQ